MFHKTQRAKWLVGLAIAGLLSQIAVRAVEFKYLFTPFVVAAKRGTATLNYTHPNTIIGPDAKIRSDQKVQLFFDVYKLQQPDLVNGDKPGPSKYVFVGRQVCDQVVSVGEATSFSVAFVQDSSAPGNLIRPGVLVSVQDSSLDAAPPSLELILCDGFDPVECNGSYNILIGLLLPAGQKGQK
ncbi:MAG: hypothetical protein ABI651_14695 [Verrucomicrobiota bacterium]